METTTKCVAALGLVSAAVIAGFITGRGTSRRTDAPSTAFIYLTVHGKWTHIDPSHSRIELPAGPKVYSYATGDGAVGDHFIPPEQLARYKQPINLDDDTEKLVGMVVAPPAEGGIIALYVKSSASGATRTVPKSEVAILTLITAGSFGLGYYFGHRPEPDFEEPKFHEALTKNVALWNELDSAYHDLYLQRCVAREMKPRMSARFAEADAALVSKNQILTLHPEIQLQVDKDANCVPSP